VNIRCSTLGTERPDFRTAMSQWRFDIDLVKQQ
jgi:hypothetical protein